MSGRHRGDRGRYSRGRRGAFGSPEMRRYILGLWRAGHTVSEIINILIYGEPGGGGGDSGGDSGGGTTPEPEPEPGDGGVLKVVTVDLQVATNVEAHHTDQYDIVEGSDPHLVVRRGQPFSLKINLSRPFSDRKDDLRLIFEIGEEAESVPRTSKGTRVSFLLSDTHRDGTWGAKLLQKSGKSLDVNIFTPPNCIVGKWSLSLKVLNKADKQVVSQYSLKKNVYVLFNPWCTEDVVYREGDNEREEYVLNDTGVIYSGSQWSPYPRKWSYGQFSGKVLDCTLYLLNKSNMLLEKRGNPITVVRKLTAMVNVQDDDGVLVGNWSGEYEDGASPSSWTGSASILEQYFREKSPVRYGQCWVFAGVLNTVCRALGIPCRTVTNFASAHDTDVSMTIDVHFDEKGDEIDHMNSDSIWNFHVWNEVWFRRDNLPDGYGGWQACDATPQETSEGFCQCGPCPVQAIKEGEVTVPYDGFFIFAEVNSDRVFWEKQADGEFIPKRLQKNVVGKKMSTRALDGGREDVTGNYKYPEESSEERAAVHRAYQLGEASRDAYDTGPQDVNFKINFKPDSPVGEDFMMQLKCHNTSGQDRTLSGHGVIKTMFYTGINAQQVVKKKFKSLQLRPGASQTVDVLVTAEEYRRHLKDGCFLSLTFVCFVTETKQTFIETDTVMLSKPELTIKGPDKGRVGEEFGVTVSFTNPLPSTLTDCYLNVECQGITKSEKHPLGDVLAGGTVIKEIKLKPKKKGKRNIIFLFSSLQLDNITGEHDTHIRR